MLRCGGSGGEVSSGASGGFRVVGEEFFEPFHRMGADAVEDVAKIDERLDLESRRRRDEAGEDRGGSAAVIAAEDSQFFRPTAIPRRLRSPPLLSIPRSPSPQ